MNKDEISKDEISKIVNTEFLNYYSDEKYIEKFKSNLKTDSNNNKISTEELAVGIYTTCINDFREILINTLSKIL